VGASVEVEDDLIVPAHDQQARPRSAGPPTISRPAHDQQGRDLHARETTGCQIALWQGDGPRADQAALPGPIR